MTQQPQGRTIELSWSLPVVATCDVCVVGGGSAGIAAAVAAARAGARTILIERYGFLGGTSTAGMVGPFMTSYSADGRERIIAGIFQELVDRMVRLGGAIDPSRIDAGTKWTSFIETGHARLTPYSPEACKLAALELVEEAGVETWYHTSFVRALTEGGRVSGIVVHNKSGMGVVEARNFVDCSADADLAADAGVPCRKGRESDGKMMPATMFMRIGNVDDAKVEAWAAAHPGERLFATIVAKARAEERWSYPRDWLNLFREPAPGVYRCNITRLLGVDGTNARDLSRAEAQGRRDCLTVFDFLKANCPGLENAQLLETAAQIGIRETRRIVGRYTVTGEDVLEGRRFPDAIGRGSYPVDIHDPTGTRVKMVALGNRPDRQVLTAAEKQAAAAAPTPADAPTYYEIPFRCLLPQNVDNLLVAGRPVSATHEGAASLRVIPPCYAMGQAAGLAAAMSAQRNVPPPEIDIAGLQAALRAQGAIV